MTCLKNKLIILMLAFISFTFNIVPLLPTFNRWELPCLKVCLVSLLREERQSPAIV